MVQTFEKRNIIQEESAKHFREALESLNATEEQIKEQSSTELKQTLEHINQALDNPSKYGVFQYSPPKRHGPATKSRYKTSASSEANGYYIDINIESILLERKEMVIERLKHLMSQERDIRVKGVTEEHTTDETVDLTEAEQKEINEFEKNEAELKKEGELVKVRKDFKLSEIELRTQMQELELNRLERRSKVWQIFLARESVSTIIGGILLLIMTTCLLIAMFSSITATDIIENAFLLILGYFFGSTVTKVTTA